MDRQNRSTGIGSKGGQVKTAYHDADAAALLREDPESGWDWLVVRAEEPYEGWKPQLLPHSWPVPGDDFP